MLIAAVVIVVMAMVVWGGLRTLRAQVEHKVAPMLGVVAKVAASLTPTLIQQPYLVRWNGQLPQYSLGGDNGVFLRLPGGIQK